MAIRQVILDFDGSCTRVQDIGDAFLARYGQLFGQIDPRIAAEWESALAQVRARAPEAGWMISGTPSAPCDADPYILAFEAARLLAWKFDLEGVPADLHGIAYDAHPAAPRPDLVRVLQAIDARGLRIAFISNSATRKIETRLDEWLADDRALRRRIVVFGDAAKFRVREIAPGTHVPFTWRRAFDALPGTASIRGLARPVPLRRGAYLEALAAASRHADVRIEDTLVCGDIWDLDLALPAALGTSVHLITRAEPFSTHSYERAAASAFGERARTTDDLAGLLAAWFPACG